MRTCDSVMQPETTGFHSLFREPGLYRFLPIHESGNLGVAEL